MERHSRSDSTCGSAGHGVPDPATQDEPTGLPTSDRHHSETAPHVQGGDADAPKHSHTP
jgi:hypothetical protein